MQGYNMDKADTQVAIEGGQDISFDFTASSLRQRIDRNFIPSGRPLSHAHFRQNVKADYHLQITGPGRYHNSIASTFL
jgi:hypothetical protein